MKKHRAIIFITILLIITGIMTMIHLRTREEVSEGAIEVTSGEDTSIVDITELSYETVTGIRVNGKRVSIRALQPEDVIMIGNIEMGLVPISHRQEQKLAQLRRQGNMVTLHVLGGDAE